MSIIRLGTFNHNVFLQAKDDSSEIRVTLSLSETEALSKGLVETIAILKKQIEDEKYIQKKLKNGTMKTFGQVVDEISKMNDGGAMEIYKKNEFFRTKMHRGWTPPTGEFCPKCGDVMKITGTAKLSLPPQDECKCEKCKYTRNIIRKE